MLYSNKLMIVGAVYTLNLLIFVAFGFEVTGVWLDATVTLALAVVAYWLARTQERDLKPFFALLAIAAVFNLTNLLTWNQLPWNQGLYVPATAWSSVKGSNQVPLSYIFLGLFLFFWNCAWLYLSTTLVRRQGIGLAHWMALFVLLGFIATYVEQIRSFNLELLDAEHRFLLLLFLLELFGVLLGVMCILLGVARPYLLMIVGFALFAAIHIVGIHLILINHGADTPALQPLWTLGRAFIFAGIWLLLQPRTKGEADTTSTPNSARAEVELEEPDRKYSQLSSLLIVFTLGAVFVVAAFNRILEGTTEWFAMFFVMFCVTCAIFMSIATSRFDRAISYSRSQMMGVFNSRLSHIRAGSEETGILRTLKLTGLDNMLSEFRKASRKLRDDVIVLGPERVYRSKEQRISGATPRCFIVMPFGEPWSAEVDRQIRGACTNCGVQAVRGDDIFSPTDILDDIWQQIITADFVIADVTNRNTNVFYELGMAHTVGKPVIILSQRESDVPIDLKTRRWIAYDPEHSDDLAAVLCKSVTQVLEMYQLNGSIGSERR
ncbi:MAG: hypothetical protein GY792_17510 [Gammaproteobacteria bacterium]|nr:hypothetical protein [Gammaproteobacteria bacterium]